MRIGCLQFAPLVGDTDNNLNRADAILNRADPENLDLLVLPELAFSGYNFQSLQEISPYLEHSGSGISSLWARTVALKHDCTVVVGYPEKVDLSQRWPAGPEYYNSAIVVNPDGETVANYRKNHLFRTDETWALENSHGFFQGHLVGLGQTAIGICMDINPYKFQAPWEAFEFGFHILEADANLVILTMAWMTHEDGQVYSRWPKEPDMETLMYWITRLEPVIRAEGDEEIIIVFANRTGAEGTARYTGTSAVVGIKDGEVLVYGILGRGEKDLLVIDTEMPPFAKLVHRPHEGTADAQDTISLVSEPIRQLPKTGVLSNYETIIEHEEKREETPKPVASKPPVQDPMPKEQSRSSPSKEQQNALKETAQPTPKIDQPPSTEAKDKLKSKSKLSLKTDDDTLFKGQRRDAGIRTPTGPSPTPGSVRPQVSIPSAASSTTKYGEMPPKSKSYNRRSGGSNHVATPHPLSTSTNRSFILGGKVTISRDEPAATKSPSGDSLSHFSDASPSSPRLYWTTPNNHLKSWLHERGWTPGAIVDRAEGSQRDSIISNNTTADGTNERSSGLRRAAQPNSIASSTSVTNPKPAFSPPMIQEGFQQYPAQDRIRSRLAASSSRRGDQPRDYEWPRSPMDPNIDLRHINAKLDEISERVNLVQGQLSNLQISPTGQTVATDSEVEELKALLLMHPNDPMRRYARLWDDSGDQRPSSLPVPPRDRRNFGDEDLSGPSDTRKRSTVGYDRRRDLRAQNTFQPDPISTVPVRTISRGRQPRQPAEISRPQTGLPRHRRSANRLRPSASVEPVSPSEIRRIEEYISPNCPLHGDRATSEHRNRKAHQHRRIPSTGTRQCIPITPPTNSTETFPSIAQTILPTSGHSLVPSSRRLVTDLAPPVETPTAGNPSPNTPFEPQTPKAMALVYDMQDSAIPELSLKGAEKMTKTNILRPKSAGA